MVSLLSRRCTKMINMNFSDGYMKLYSVFKFRMNAIVIFTRDVYFSSCWTIIMKTYQHIYLPILPEKCRRVVESTVWCGSSECPFSPVVQHKINFRGCSSKPRGFDCFSPKSIDMFILSLHCLIPAEHYRTSYSPLCPAGRRGTPCRSALVFSVLGRWSPVCL